MGIDYDAIRARALDAAREANEPYVVDIPAYTGDGTIQVVVRRVDLEQKLLEAGLANPAAAAVLTRTGGDASAPSPADMMDEIQRLPGLLDAVCEHALVAPTWEEFREAGGLTFAQKLAIMDAVTAHLRDLGSFRGDSSV